MMTINMLQRKLAEELDEESRRFISQMLLKGESAFPG
jgi:hypothetical protein